MNDQKSLDALLRFLDYLKDKGLLKANTAVSRKAAATKILSALAPEEQQDVTVLDLNEVMARFANLQGQNYTPDSLTAYKSRLKSTLDDFEAYLTNPMGFRPQLQGRTRSSKPESGAKSPARVGAAKQVEKSGSSGSGAPPPPDAIILPIPVRADLVVRVHGLPFDLTEAEANKIVAVIKAMAVQGL